MQLTPYGPRPVGRANQVCLPARALRRARLDGERRLAFSMGRGGVPYIRVSKAAIDSRIVRTLSSVRQVVVPASLLSVLSAERGDHLYVVDSGEDFALWLVSMKDLDAVLGIESVGVS